jgi:hypothetical protein
MYMLALLTAAVQTTVSNGKQQNGVATELEEVVVACFKVLCYHSPGGSEENGQLSEDWIYSARFDIEASKLHVRDITIVNTVHQSET